MKLRKINKMYLISVELFEINLFFNALYCMSVYSNCRKTVCEIYFDYFYTYISFI